ncbi:hypothetical protein F5B19DRAFT_501202 [Rostrohypoxylon terebratum]|nr:hypothetical protein F5B19DRAFT_501202 [Rostrohypoxylon terebratum]
MASCRTNTITMQFKSPFPLVITPLIPPHSTQATVDGIHAVETEVSGVSIFHSGYPLGYSPLLYFPALDDGGIDYNLAYLACCILVGNSWPRDERDNTNCPYLAESSDPAAPHLTRPLDGILRKSSYYLFVPACPQPQFPVTPNFSNWLYPHGNLPDIFRDITIQSVPWHKIQNTPRIIAEAVASRDECCRVTQAFSGSQHAHIIPRSVGTWFLMNDMSRYSYNKASWPAVDDISNGIYLRSDIHHMLDQSELIMFPKYTGDKYEVVLHVLLHDLYGISREFLFARFAWSIFQDDTFRFFQTQHSPFEIMIHEPGIETRAVTKHADSATAVARLAPPFAESRGSKRPRGPFGDDEECRWVYSVRAEKMVCLSDQEEEELMYDDNTDDTDIGEDEFRPRKVIRLF